jgi:hypothetical protein
MALFHRTELYFVVISRATGVVNSAFESTFKLLWGNHGMEADSTGLRIELQETLGVVVQSSRGTPCQRNSLRFRRL